jgi:hypothetical protein
LSNFHPPSTLMTHPSPILILSSHLSKLHVIAFQKFPNLNLVCIYFLLIQTTCPVHRNLATQAKLQEKKEQFLVKKHVVKASRYVQSPAPADLQPGKGFWILIGEEVTGDCSVS